jgi:hypothetical protein
LKTKDKLLNISESFIIRCFNLLTWGSLNLPCGEDAALVAVLDDEAVSFEVDCPKAKEAVNTNTKGVRCTIFAKLTPVRNQFTIYMLEQLENRSGTSSRLVGGCAMQVYRCATNQ